MLTKPRRRPSGGWMAPVILVVIAAACASPFADEVSYCDAATTLQHRYADARAMEGKTSVSVLADAYNQMELQAEVVRDAAPEAAHDDWAAVAGPGDAGAAAGRAFA